jgi:hypothetical protein
MVTPLDIPWPLVKPLVESSKSFCHKSSKEKALEESNQGRKNN